MMRTFLPSRLKSGRWLVVLGVAVVSFLAPAQAADFSSGGSFLQLGHGARAHGLGGAGVALIHDDAAIYWNPANLAFLQEQTSLTLMHADILPGIDDGYNSISFARRVGPALGDANQISRPTRWGYGLFFSNMSFDFESGAGWSESVLQLGAAYAVNNFTSIGSNLKFLNASNDFDAGDATGFGLDLAISVIVFDQLTFALVGRDLLGEVNWDTDKSEDLEANIVFGFDYRPWRSWAFDTEASFQEGSLRRFILASEFLPYQDLLALRGALTFLKAGESRSYPSFGIGTRASHFKLDYGISFDNEEAFDLGHRVSLGLGF